MKKLIYLVLAAVLFAVGCSESFDDSKIWDKLDDHESRISQLEELCKQMNTNISSLQTIVKALQNNDYVTGVTPITKDGETIGYTITFTKSQPITIYHGEDGKDGQNGTDGKDGVDGKDGSTPIIGVKQDTDNIYYWTLNGELPYREPTENYDAYFSKVLKCKCGSYMIPKRIYKKMYEFCKTSNSCNSNA